MSAATSAKRARADTAGRSIDRPDLRLNGPEPIEPSGDSGSSSADSDSSGSQSPALSGTPSSDIDALIEELSSEEVQNILAQAAATHPDVLQKINDIVSAKRQREGNRVVDFDYYSGSVWKTLNITYRSLSGSEQYHIADEVMDEIDGTIAHIVLQCRRSANPQTRYNGLSVLRKIGKSILLSRDTLAHEVQKLYQSNHSLDDGMRSIVAAMSPEEKGRIRRNDADPEGLWLKLLELEKLADNCCFTGIGKVIKLLDDQKDRDKA
jgi:hypothetical protein